MTGQVARGSCADSDADAAERNGARVRWKQQRARAGGRGRAGLVVEELLLALAVDGCV